MIRGSLILCSVSIPITILQLKRLFEEKILLFLSQKAVVLIGVTYIKDDFTGRSEELLSDPLLDKAYMFQSPRTWLEIIGNNERIEAIEDWEMDCFDNAWSEWFATEHKYALGNFQFF